MRKCRFTALRHLHAIVCAALILFVPFPTAAAATLAGSDLLVGGGAEALQKQSAAIPGGLRLLLDGSLMGEKHLRNGTADAALLLLPDKAKIPEITKGEWEAVPIAYQTLVVVVNKANRLPHMDLSSLAAIYGELQRSKIQHWRDAPVSASGVDMPVFPVLTRYDLGVVVPLFRNRVLQNNEFKSTVAFRPDDATAEETVSTTPNGIGILSVPPDGDRVRVLPLLLPGTTNAYMPTASNLYNGDYPLAIPVYLVFARKNAAKVKPLLPVVLGDALADSLPKLGFVAAPKNLRMNFLRRLDSLP
ncbi:MAG: hypothetical protein LBD14_00650 [Puniceicoccales bacterium]|jgi:phosphate transport system substrate-binding protein|nr:hypothetical protein [Puniceicoccales bacterium]